MKRPTFEVVEKKNSASEHLLLIIDKKGILGILLAKELSSHGTIVFVSAHDPIKKHPFGNIVYVAHQANIPAIPDNSYAEIFFIAESKTEIIEFLPGLIKKTGETKSHLILVIPLTARDKEVEDALLAHKNIRVVYRGEVFGEEIFLSQSDVVNTFLRQALERGRIDIPESGMQKTFPVHFTDVVMGILEAAYGAHVSRIFFLFPKHPPTALAVARVLQKTEPLLRVDFTGQTFPGVFAKEHQIPSATDMTYLLEEHYQTEKKLQRCFRELLTTFSYAHKQLPFPENNTASAKKNYPRKTIFSYWLWKSFMVTTMIILVMPALLFVATSIVGLQQLLNARQSLERGDTEKAHRQAMRANTAFAVGEGFERIVEKEAATIGQKERLAVLLKVVAVGKETATILLNGSEGITIYKNVFSGATKNPKSDLAKGSRLIKQVVTSLQKLRAEDKKDMPESLQKAIENISLYDGVGRLVVGTIDTYPEIFGFLGEKTYLLTFQNNMELRPGGGFIGSFAIVSVENGRIKKFSLRDVYDADGQLKGHVEPPFALRRYLPIPHWYLRDSNFNPDYAKGASMSAFFLQQEMEQAVDGVLAVDVSFLKKLLEATGPLFVSEYSETVTAENVYPLTQMHAEKDFFPGSTQKKDFLKSLFNAITIHFSAKGNTLPYLRLGKIMEEAIAQKHVLFAFANPSIQDVFTINGMSSTLSDNRKRGTDEIVDFLGISEANLGANKVNYFMRRRLYQAVSVDEKGNIQQQLAVRFKNTSKKEDVFGGEYKTFFRVIVPLGSKLTGVLIDGKEQKIAAAITDPKIYEAKGFRPPNELEVETTEQDNTSIFGFLVIVPVDSFKTVTVNYTLPQTVSLTIPSFTYKQKVFKQPGTENDLYSFAFTYPSSYKIFVKPKGAVDANGLLRFEAQLLSDVDFALQFSKK